MLALAQGGTESEMKSVVEALAAAGVRSAAFEIPQPSPRLRVALEAAGRPTLDEAIKAASRAAIFTI